MYLYYISYIIDIDVLGQAELLAVGLLGARSWRSSHRIQLGWEAPGGHAQGELNGESMRYPSKQLEIHQSSSNDNDISKYI